MSSGTARLYGTVADRDDGDAVWHGQIILEPAGCGVLSDSAGRWGFTDLPAGRYTVRFRLLGYDSLSRTVELGANESERVDFRPPSRPVELYRRPPSAQVHTDRDRIQLEIVVGRSWRASGAIGAPGAR